MRTLVLGPRPPELERLLERRRRLGLDGYDEVWEETYHMAPMARSRHGWLQVQLARLLGPRADAAGLVSVGPFNLGDGPDDFRVPDLGLLRALDPEAVYLPTAAMVVEVVSPGDETYEKLPFYAARLVDEVLIIDPEQREVQILVRDGDRYAAADASALLRLATDELGAAIRWR